MTGSEWLKTEAKITPSPLGARVADVLGWVMGGIKNLPQVPNDRAAWADEQHIVVYLWATSLTMWNGARLSLLTMACHEACLVVEIGRPELHKHDYVSLMFCNAKRGDNYPDEVATLENAVKRFRKYWPGSLTWEVTE